MPIDNILNMFDPITLSEMKSVKLMNRTDTKFVTTLPMLERLLEMAQGEYFAQVIDGERNMLYDTTYFDTRSFDMYQEHQTGHTNRQKLTWDEIADKIPCTKRTAQYIHGRALKNFPMDDL